MNGPGKMTGQGLIALGATAAAPGGFYRPSAPVLTQLVAASLDLPQTRARRRASTEEGVAAYGATGAALRLARRTTGASWPA